MLDYRTLRYGVQVRNKKKDIVAAIPGDSDYHLSRSVKTSTSSLFHESLWLYEVYLPFVYNAEQSFLSRPWRPTSLPSLRSPGRASARATPPSSP